MCLSHTRTQIALYVTDNADNGDTLNGHGTFCASEIAGEVADASFASLAPWNGLAPKARIAFVDISTGSLRNLSIPPDLASGTCSSILAPRMLLCYYYY